MVAILPRGRWVNNMVSGPMCSALFCCGHVKILVDSYYPYSSGLLHWPWPTQIAPHFNEILINFHTRKHIRKCCQQSVGHFVQAPMCQHTVSRTIWLICCRWHLNAFSWKHIFIFSFSFHWTLFLEVQLIATLVQAINGLVPNRQQAITWTNDNPPLTPYDIIRPQWVNLGMAPRQVGF